ncbi:T9SS type A sorting domain-containing protein [Hymenobacter properus]|uniref:T9SS type A sorting domain-containing protein n=1 Tax=Hymenobacter properus TaxID=2791026 RepID=A0A931BFU7_9BACT|nr:T9SS type A sorting domain-containing protein [Hymenobacter properus]MBF9140891.1 T9SS type A sorting domain-containing protein [Hymenobacter properus]MBR7719700.1 T9SS type A sorting domain-containing protein [Microvirga sp. SRT04]
MPKANPAVQQRTTALSLPFFDDFITPLDGAPDPRRWVPTGGALVSNRLALAPLTRGAATLDGLKANGQNYSGSTGVFYSSIDSLKSQEIDLSGLTVNDQVYLSFAWQAGSIVGTPNGNSGSTPVRLELYLKNSTNTWVRAWSYNSQRVRTGFRQQVMDLNQTQYLHGTFQFMLVASGNASDNSDNWNIDYVLLDRGRARGLTDTTFVDVATGAGLVGSSPSGGLRSPLRRYTAMPVWQFNAATTSELSANLGVNLTNLELPTPPLSRPITVTGTVRDLTAGTTLGTWLQTPRLIVPNVRNAPQTGSAATVAVPATATPKRLRYTLTINTNGLDAPRATPNDTISRDVDLNNYFAYDDGTAEAYTQIPARSTGQAEVLAYRFNLNQPDHVGGLRLYPVYTPADVSARPVTISVWNDDAGHPSATPVATKTATLPGTGPLPSGLPYVEITFDQPVPVSGIFYVGFSQPSTGRFLSYGKDLNNYFPPGYLWNRNYVGVWDSTRFVGPRGALMMRPVMTNNVTTATASAREAAAYSLYPNPARGTVRVEGPGFARATLLDALGRTVWEQPAAQAGQATLPLPTLPPGVYTVRLLLADGRTVGRRLMLE